MKTNLLTFALGFLTATALTSLAIAQEVTGTRVHRAPRGRINEQQIPPPPQISAVR